MTADSSRGAGTITHPRIFLSPPDVGELERQFLLDAFDSNWIAPLGPHVDAFEKEASAYVGVSAAAALSSGTAAIHLGLLLLGVRPGDLVVCSTFTFVATANAIRYCGAEPVFIDSDRISWNMDPDLLEEALERLDGEGRRPAVILVVDLYGQAADYRRISEISRRFDIPILEDAAEALGASNGSSRAGSFGKISVLSFNGNKILTTSGGGMLLSDDEELVGRARFLASQARKPAPYYEHETTGYNYRMSNLLAALGRAQLQGLDRKVERRRRNYDRYFAEFGQTPGVTFMPEPLWSRSTRWLTCMLVDPAEAGVSREELRLALEAENIESRPLWKPMHLQPLFSDSEAIGGAVSSELFESGLCLPSGSSLSEPDLDRIVRALRERGLAQS